MDSFLPVSRGYLIAGVVVAVGVYMVTDAGSSAPRAEPSVATPTAVPRAMISSPMPMLPVLAGTEDNLDDSDVVDEDVRGHAPIEDIAEFAMVFEVDGISYLRLSTDLRATARGEAHMSVHQDVYAVVAPVAVSAIPAEVAGWNGRTVLVDGTCRARVIGFAEVSRVSGDPPGSEAYWYGDEEERSEKPEWTLDSVVADNVTLAAKLDDCSGTWARSTDYEPAQVAHVAKEPELEAQALANLLAKEDIDPLQTEWKDGGGEGDWRDAVDVNATTYEHPVTHEKWIFAQAYKAGTCGEPGVTRMAAYRVGTDGTVRTFTELDFAGDQINQVVDFDGDGQPELVLGSGDSTELVDLANTRHESISVPVHHYGCGC